MKKMISPRLTIILLLLSFTTANATVWYVHPDSLINSIQVGLDSCSTNDTVLVGAGTYVENINWPNTQSINLISEFGINASIIDGNSAERVIECITGVDSTTIISGFTIQNGYTHHGGGIFCWGSSPSLENITITGNTAVWGGGILCWDCSPNLCNVTVAENNADSSGGGIYCLDNSNPGLTNVIISGNIAGKDGGGIYCNYANASLVNCILWNDTPNEIDGDPVDATYSDIQGGWSGTGNIDEDPMFVSGPLSDYHLCPFTPSPCIDAGNPDAQYNDPEDPLIPGYAMWPALGTIRSDMGVYGGPRTQVWTGVEEEIYNEEVFTFSKAYPNPFIDRTQIEYNLPIVSNVNIAVYNVLGARVSTLLNKRQNPGRYTITWDGNDYRGNKLPSGFYFLRLETGEYKGTRKLLLIR